MGLCCFECALGLRCGVGFRFAYLVFFLTFLVFLFLMVLVFSALVLMVLTLVVSTFSGSLLVLLIFWRFCFLTF